jgi:hypothetical protein
VRITDISVSRCHAYLKLVDGCVWIEDLKSKFGTMYTIDNPVKIEDSHGYIQCGRTLLKLKIQKKSFCNKMNIMCNKRTKKVNAAGISYD